MIFENVIRLEITQLIISQKRIVECGQHVSKDLVFDHHSRSHSIIDANGITLRTIEALNSRFKIINLSN